MSTRNSTDPSGLGERLRRLRGERSQEEFGALVGLTRSAVANYETERTTPKPSILKDISRKLGISEDFLLTGRVRNECELNMVVAGRGILNECHETDDELAIIHVLRAASPEAVREIVERLLKAVEDDSSMRGRLRGLRIDEDIARLGAIYQSGGVFQQGGSEEENDAFLQALARQARGL